MELKDKSSKNKNNGFNGIFNNCINKGRKIGNNEKWFYYRETLKYLINMSLKKYLDIKEIWNTYHIGNLITL